MSGYHNLKGEPIDFMALQAAGVAQRRLARSMGIAHGRKPTVKKGYAAQPGTGPEGKTCRDCKHKTTMSNTGSKSWIKCELRRSTWTSGEGTDIKASAAACSKFEAKDGKPYQSVRVIALHDLQNSKGVQP